MFKSLLYTIPTLSGNVSLSCALNNNVYNSETDEYDSFVQAANLVPLQNDLTRYPILVNLLEGSWEYDIAKFYKLYEKSFYEPNYTIYQNDYEKVSILGSKPIYSRDKNYEFGCKRLEHHSQHYQFSFYAPFYIDSINDIPDCFKINLEFDNGTSKTINAHIGDKRGNANYLRNYITKYVSKIDDNVIYLLSETNQASCNGINIQYGGFAVLKDDIIGQIYYNQMTINLFDSIITETFKRTKMVMKQIIPMSFVFNINDFLKGSELRRFKYHTVNITGNFYKNGVKLPFYAFDNNYTNYKIHSYLFDKKITKNINDNEILKYVKTKEESESLTSLNYPSLHEADFYKYKYTNKFNSMYCPWKLKYSSDNNPYIFNMTFAFKHYSKNDLISSNIYGEFPVFIDTIKPLVVFTPKKLTDITLSYINTDNESDKNVYKDENDEIEKYYKIRNNHVSDWFVPYSYSTFLDEENWTPVNNNKCYNKGILYNLSYFDPINYYNDNYVDTDLAYLKDTLDSKLDKFSVFLNFNMENYAIEDMNNINPTEYVLNSAQDKNFNMYAYHRPEGFVPVFINDDDAYTYTYNGDLSMINLESNKIMTYYGYLKDMVSPKYDNDGDYSETYVLKNEYDAYSNAYYINYSSTFTNNYYISIPSPNHDDVTNFSNDYGYMALEISYINLKEGDFQFGDGDNDNSNQLYYSRNNSTEYEKLNDASWSQLKNTEYKYTIYKRYPIKKCPTETSYAFVPLCDTGDNIYTNAIIKPNKDYRIYVDEYDLNIFIDAYNNAFGKYFEDDYLDNKLSITTYARFINYEHLQKYPKYLSRDKNDDLLYSSRDICENVYMRERYLSYNWRIYDKYMPLTYYNINSEYEYQEFIKDLTRDELYFIRTDSYQYTNEENEICTGNVVYSYDLFFKKKFYCLTDDLYSAMVQNLTLDTIIPLQLYVKNFEDKDKITEKYHFISKNDIIIPHQDPSFISTEEYLVPLLSNIYINSVTKEDIMNIIYSGNIYVKDVMSDDNTDRERDQEWTQKYVYFNKFKTKCMISLDLYLRYYSIIFTMLGDPDNGDPGLPVYHIKDFMKIDVDNLPDSLINIIGEDYKINYISDSDKIITFMHNNEKYGMYFMNINCTNTKYTFNFDETSSMIFFTVNGSQIKNDQNEINNSMLAELIPYFNSNIFADFISKLSTVIIPATFILKSKYIPIVSQSENSINRYKYLTSNNNTEPVYDIKFIENSKQKIKLNRYTDYITPYIPEVDNHLFNRFNKLFKLTDKKFNECNLEAIDLNVYKHNGLRVGTDYDYENNVPTIMDIDLIEYKHFNENMLYNLEEKFEIPVNGLLTYDEMLEKESFKETFAVFEHRILKYNHNLTTEDKDIILFLYNRYNISYTSTSTKLNKFKNTKLYKLIYKFSLI